MPKADVPATGTEPLSGGLDYLANALATETRHTVKRLAPALDEATVVAVCEYIRERVTQHIEWAAEARNWWAHQEAAKARAEEPTGGVHRVDGWVVCCSDCGTVMVDQHEGTGWRVIEYASKSDAYEGADGGDPTGFLMFQDPTVCVGCAIVRPDLMGPLAQAANEFRAEFMADDAPGVPDYPPLEES